MRHFDINLEQYLFTLGKDRVICNHLQKPRLAPLLEEGKKVACTLSRVPNTR